MDESRSVHAGGGVTHDGCVKQSASAQSTAASPSLSLPSVQISLPPEFTLLELLLELELELELLELELELLLEELLLELLEFAGTQEQSEQVDPEGHVANPGSPQISFASMFPLPQSDPGTHRQFTSQVLPAIHPWEPSHCSGGSSIPLLLQAFPGDEEEEEIEEDCTCAVSDRGSKETPARKRTIRRIHVDDSSLLLTMPSPFNVDARRMSFAK